MTRDARRFWAAWAVLLGLCLLWNAASLLESSSRRDQRYLYGWDENHYFAWARSAVVDGDIDFRNDFAYVGSLRGMGETQSAFAKLVADHPDGTPIPNKYGIGTGLLAMPSLGIAHGLRRGYEALSGVEVSNFATVYVLAYLFNQITLGFVGLAVCFILFRRIFSKRRAAGVVAIAFAGLPLAYYIWWDAAMSHAAGFAVSSAFVFATVRWTRAFSAGLDERGLRKDAVLWAISMGLLLGLDVLVRFPNGVFALMPAAMGFANWWWEGRANWRRFFVHAMAHLVVAAGAFLIAMIPQFLAWKALYGSAVVYSYQGESLGPFPVHALQVLAGTANGLLLWSPAAGFAIVGLFLGVRHRDPLCVGAAVVLAAFLWIYGAWWAYSMGSSFGQRGFVDAAALFMIGLARLLDRRERWLRPALALSVVWSLWMLFAVRAEVQPLGSRFVGTQLIRQGPRIAGRPFVEARAYRNLFRKKYPVFTPKNSVVAGQ